MNPLYRLVCSFVGLCLPALAQDQATTLLASCLRADAVVRATVVTATDPSPEWHRLVFRTEEVLAGQLGAQFAVLEPAGACCGRSLFALQPGNACLLFLRREGPTWHPLGGARGVLQDEAELTVHVRALLDATDDPARARLLVTGLQSRMPRIAADAAHSLATLPALQLDAGERAVVTTALAEAVALGRTTAASLVEVAVRLEDAPMLDALLPLYLDQVRADRAALLRQALTRCSPANLVGRLPLYLRGEDHRELRAAELLAELPAAESQGALRSLLANTRSPRVQLCAVESLLDCGLAVQSLRGSAPAQVLDLAERRRNTPKSFRAIRTAQR